MNNHTLVHGGFSDGIYNTKTGERVFSASVIEMLGYKWGRLIGQPDSFISSIVPELTRRYERWLKS